MITTKKTHRILGNKGSVGQIHEVSSRNKHKRHVTVILTEGLAWVVKLCHLSRSSKLPLAWEIINTWYINPIMLKHFLLKFVTVLDYGNEIMINSDYIISSACLLEMVTCA